MLAKPPTILKRVLLVDDEAAVIHITRRMLELGGYVVTGATSAVEGLRLLETGTWDLVITDRLMSEMNGEDFATHIKRRLPELPVLLITGFPESVVHGERFVAIVRKPFATEDLLLQVARTIGTTR
jgi:CheY-like chemotaxis protein